MYCDSYLSVSGSFAIVKTGAGPGLVDGWEHAFTDDWLFIVHDLFLGVFLDHDLIVTCKVSLASKDLRHVLIFLVWFVILFQDLGLFASHHLVFLRHPQLLLLLHANHLAHGS